MRPLVANTLYIVYFLHTYRTYVYMATLYLHSGSTYRHYNYAIALRSSDLRIQIHCGQAS